MVGSRTLTALVGVLGSLTVSVALYWYTGSVLFFLFVPFVPFLFVPFVPFLFGSGTESRRKRCERWGFTTAEETHDYCPRDGSRLIESTGDH